MASIGQELLNIPFGDMVESLGLAIAEAQHALDMNSVQMAQMMSGSRYIEQDDNGNYVVREGVKVMFGGRSVSLLELGFSPTFYQFVDTIIEVKLSISMSSNESRSASSKTTSMSSRVGWGWGSASARANVSTVSANYAVKNSYSAEGASLIRTKLVPLPAPAILEQRIRQLMEERQQNELVLQPDLIEIMVNGTKAIAVFDGSGKQVTESLTFSSSSDSIATVDSKGTVTAKGAGVAVISVRTTAGANSELKVLVKAPPPPPTTAP